MAAILNCNTVVLQRLFLNVQYGERYKQNLMAYSNILFASTILREIEILKIAGVTGTQYGRHHEALDFLGSTSKN